MTTTDNLPATTTSGDVVPFAEQVVVALADKEWDDVEDGHLGNTVTPRLPRTLLNRKIDGGFTDELTGERRPDLHFVWLADTVTRAWWPEAFGKGDKKPSCRSRDGIHPDPESPERQAGACAGCQHSKWTGDDAPACAESVEVMVYLLEEKRLSLIRFGGMAVSRVSRYLGALNAHVPRKPPIAYVTYCELEGVDTANGTFLVPRFSVAGEIPRAEATPLIELRRAKVAEWQSQLADDLAEGRDDETPTAGPFDDAAAPKPGGDYVAADGEPF